MKFNIIGADRDTGENIEMTIEAVDKSAAQESAFRKGILVSRIVPVLTPHPPSAPTTAAPQRLEQGHHRGAPLVNIAPPRRGNSLGVASMILGILAFLICWIPLLNLLGVPLSALGLLLGLIGFVVALTRGGSSIGYPIAGSAICGLALFVAISITGAFVSGTKSISDELSRESQRRGAMNPTPTPANAPGADRSPEESLVADKPSSAMVPPSPPTASTSTAQWVPANTPVIHGDVQVAVLGVRIGKVPLKTRYTDGTGESQDVLLMIAIEIANTSETRKVNYLTWGGGAISFGSRTSLSDNFDNRYRVVDFGFGNEVIGAVESESIYPGKSIQDVLVFEVPVEGVEFLNLELPASQFDGAGMLRIRIPASMIQR